MIFNKIFLTHTVLLRQVETNSNVFSFPTPEFKKNLIDSKFRLNKMLSLIVFLPEE